MKAVRRAVTMAAGGQPACGKRIRVVTYNLLSSSLADPGYFPRCDPANLDADTRLRRIERALAEEMRPCQEANGGRGAVLCLQEVSTKWLGPLHVFMSSRDYHLVTSNYGHHKTGYMGVCIAYPTRHFAAVDVELKRVGDHLDDAPVEKRERRPPEAAGARKGAEAAPEGAGDEGSGWLASVFKALRPFGARSDGGDGGGGGGGGGAKAQKRAAQHGNNSSPREVADIWDLSRKRFNVMINVKLQCLEDAAAPAAPDGAGPPAGAGAGGDVFVVSNYHMPCVFWSPPVMVIHSSTAMQLALKFASRGSGGDGEGAAGTYPTVFAGDFNIKPHDAAYVLMTTGGIDADSDAYPAPAPASSPFGKRWTPTGSVLGEGMRSSYVVATGREPDYTNNAIIRGQDQFTETLDYIFISEHWQVDAVRPLPARPAYAEAAGGAPAASPVVDIAGKPYPDDEQPSDHLMLAATLSL